MRLTAADNNLSFVEWEVPSNLGILELSGPHLRSWSLTGDTFAGVVAEARRRNDAPARRLGAASRRRDSLRSAAGPRRCSAAVHDAAISGDGLTLKPSSLTNLTPRSDAPTREWTYTCDQEAYGGSFSTRSASIKGEFRLLTFAEVRERQLTVVTTLRTKIARRAAIPDRVGAQLGRQALDVGRS